MSAAQQARVFRFGVFELEEASGELRKQGRRVRLQGQPSQILLMLMERPGDIVSREEVRQRLWPEGTYVDFDHSLNTAINKLREALSDPASNPRFIETIPRRGYRFIAPLELTNGAGTADPSELAKQYSESTPRVAASEMPATPPRHARTARAGDPDASGSPVDVLDRILTPQAAMPQAPHSVVRVLFLLIQLMYLCFYLISLARLGVVEQIVAAMVSHSWRIVVLLMVTAVAGIPARLYLIAAVVFRASGTRENFRRLFLVLFPLDEIWALAPFLLLREIGLGLALGITAALLYLPFAQRSLILMGAGNPRDRLANH